MEDESLTSQGCPLSGQFSLQDFLLKRASAYLQYRQRPRKEISTQNYNSNYQSNDFQCRLEKIGEISSTLKKEELSAIDINRMVNIDPAPRRVPLYQQHVEALADEKYRKLEEIHHQLMHNKKGII